MVTPLSPVVVLRELFAAQIEEFRDKFEEVVGVLEKGLALRIITEVHVEEAQVLGGIKQTSRFGWVGSQRVEGNPNERSCRDCQGERRERGKGQGRGVKGVTEDIH